MGAFFLHKPNSNLLLSDARTIFKRKGFSEPKQFSLGDWTLWTYRKQLVNENNYFISEDGMAVFSCGTVVYKGLSYKSTLKCLIEDFRDKRIEQDELIGNFCLIFWDTKQISVLTDRLNIQKIFFNENRSCISSSFLSVLAASPIPLPLNKLAVYEKLSTGYIISPDTMVSGIYQLEKKTVKTFNKNNKSIQFIRHSDYTGNCLHNKGMDDSISRQITVLEKHFKKIEALNTEFLGELGLSSGYDSRLVLGCNKYLSRPFSIHTHSTGRIHDTELKIVQKIAQSKNLSVTIVNSQKLEDKNKQQINDILIDGLYFFDGRCSHNMGAFSETYTRKYKINVLGKNRLSWNGLGGEIYRNYYFTGFQKVNLRHWMNNHVYPPFASEVVGDKNWFEAMHQYRVKKIGEKIGDFTSNRKVKFIDLRKYYSKVRMPECDGNNNNAHNQLAFYHTPFFDPTIIREGINATPYIGYDGNYQAKLIEKIDSELASFQSHYGHSFSKFHMNYRLKYWTKSKIPNKIHHLRARYIDKSKSGSFIPGFMEFIGANPMLLEIKKILSDSILQDRFEMAMIDYAQRPTTMFVGSFLLEFQNKLKL